jgi:hypothetical protein
MLLQLAAQYIGQLTDIESRRVFLNPELVRVFGLPDEYDPAAQGGTEAG